MKHQLRIRHRIQIVTKSIRFWDDLIRKQQAWFSSGFETEKLARDAVSRKYPDWGRVRQERTDYAQSVMIAEEFIRDPDDDPETFEHVLALLEIYGEKLCDGYTTGRLLLGPIVASIKKFGVDQNGT